MPIIEAQPAHIPAIIALAAESWQHTYPDIISTEQIGFMLDLYYSESLMRQQMQDDAHYFWLMTEGEQLLGYAHCICDQQDATLIKLSKLYFAPHLQQQGLGRQLMNHIEQACQQMGKTVITLNVNRKNPARFFYLKMGYHITDSVDIALDKYWLNDYIMEKKLNS